MLISLQDAGVWMGLVGASYLLGNPTCIIVAATLHTGCAQPV